MSQRKILIISSWYPNRVHPTHGIFHRHFAECIALNNDVFSFHVCSDPNIQQTEIKREDFGNVKTEIVYYPKIDGNSILHKFQKHQNIKNAFLNFINRLENSWGKPDLILLNVIWPLGNYTLKLKNHWQIPLIVTENWTGYHPEDGSYKGIYLKYFTQKVIRNSNLICPVSLHLQRAMLKHGLQGDFFRIPNVVNTDLFKPLENNYYKFRFVHVSAFDDQQKNVTGIIKAFAELLKVNPNCEMHFIGEGLDFEKLKILASENIKADSVIWHGRLLGKELSEKLSSCNALVLNSRYENLPLVILEAFACGLPVITTAVGGITEWVNNKNGIITNGDNQSLTEAMLKMSNGLIAFNKNEIRQFAVDNFSYESVSKNFNSAFSKALNER